MSQRTIFLVLSAIALTFFLRFYFHHSLKKEDVEINVKQEELAPGSLRFEGTVMNTSSADISKIVVAADISDLSFDDEELRGCLLESRIAEIRNLKAGETRAVIWYYNHGENQLRCGRRVHNGETFAYTVDWRNFKWRVGVLEIE